MCLYILVQNRLQTQILPAILKLRYELLMVNVIRDLNALKFEFCREWPVVSHKGSLVWPWGGRIMRGLKINQLRNSWKINYCNHRNARCFPHSGHIQPVNLLQTPASISKDSNLQGHFFLSFFVFLQTVVLQKALPQNREECNQTFKCCIPSRLTPNEIWHVCAYCRWRDYPTSDASARPAFMMWQGWSEAAVWIGLWSVQLGWWWGGGICLRSVPSAHHKRAATAACDNHSWKMRRAVRQTNSNTYLK